MCKRDKLSYEVLSLDDPYAVEKWCEEKRETTLKSLDVVIHNAGLSMREQFINTTSEMNDKLVDIDFLSILAMVKGLHPSMNPGSTHCGVGSLAGVIGAPIRTYYCGVKGALNGFMKVLDAELANEDIHCMVANPGYVRTNVSINSVSI